MFTSQNPKSIPNIIRNNIDVYVLYRFANVKMVLEKLYEEVSNLLTETQFEELYKHATSEPHDALVIDTHPKMERDKRFKKNFNVVLTQKVFYTCFYRFKDDVAHKWKGWVVTTGGDGLGSISQVSSKHGLG